MEKFIQEVKDILGLRLSPRQVSAFERYERELIDWNSRFNLTAIRDGQGIRTKHFLDSLTCLLVMRDTPPGRLIDIGTGAGFPGIPLKIVVPQIHLTLVESVGKKADFCRHMAATLGLDRVDVIQARAEELGQAAPHREHYDWAVARSVATLPVLAEYLLPLVRVGGCVLAQKGHNGPAEVQEADRAIHLMGGTVRQLHEIHLPGVAEDRYLIVIDKRSTTPPNYPRRVGVPTKVPLG